MTITRRAEPDAKPETKELGNLLVTITDLGALGDLLQDERFHDSSQAAVSPKMEFSNGEFDDPEDLRQLTDSELREIVVSTSQVKVTLGRDRAIVAGGETQCELVYSQWARQRVTTLRPPPPKSPWWIAAALLLGTIALAVTVGFVLFGTPTPLSAGPIVALVTTFVVGFFVLTFLVTMYFVPTSYALIKPLSQEQFRDDSRTQARHLQIAVVTLGTVVAALIGALATIIAAK